MSVAGMFCSLLIYLKLFVMTCSHPETCQLNWVVPKKKNNPHQLLMRWRTIQTNWFSGKKGLWFCLCKLWQSAMQIREEGEATPCHNKCCVLASLTQSFFQGPIQQPVILLLMWLLKDDTECFRRCRKHPLRQLFCPSLFGPAQMRFLLTVDFQDLSWSCFSWPHIFRQYSILCV